MAKHFFGFAFSAFVFYNFPPADATMTRADAWIIIMYAYVIGIIIACTAEDWAEKLGEEIGKWRRKRRRRKARCKNLN